MQLASKGSPVVQTLFCLKPSAAAAVTTDKAVLDPVISLAAAKKPARTNTSDMPIMRKASLHRFLEKRKDRLNAKTPYQTAPSDVAPVNKEPESQPWLGLGPNAVKSNLNLSCDSEIFANSFHCSSSPWIVIVSNNNISTNCYEVLTWVYGYL